LHAGFFLPALRSSNSAWASLPAEGNLQRGGRIDLLQACAGGQIYVFDLHAMRETASNGARLPENSGEGSRNPGPEGIVQEAMAKLKVLLEHPNIVKARHE